MSAGVTTAARTDETIEATDAKIGAIVSESATTPPESSRRAGFCPWCIGGHSDSWEHLLPVTLSPKFVRHRPRRSWRGERAARVVRGAKPIVGPRQSADGQRCEPRAQPHPSAVDGLGITMFDPRGLCHPAITNDVATGTATDTTPKVTTAARTAGRPGNDDCAIASANPFAPMPGTSTMTTQPGP